MANAMTRMFGSLFNAVGTLAQTAEKGIDSASSAIDVLSYNTDAWRAEAKAQSNERIEAVINTSEDRIVLAISVEKQRILKILSKDEELSKLFLSIKDERKKPSE